MCHDQGGCGGKFNREIAIGNRIQRVFAYPVEAQQLGYIFALDRIAGARQCSRSQRQAVHALAAIREPLRIALQHLEIGHQMMTKTYRLCHLQMREARHDGLRMQCGEVDQSGLQRLYQQG